MPNKATGTDGTHGNYDYMKLLSEFSLVLKNFDWMNDAACQGEPTDLFFPETGFNSTARVTLAICKRCPVRGKCLEFALTNGIEHGIWGGTTAPQRKTMRRMRDTLDS
jgi:WhiB family redox-sensing transcriptional regulator